MSIGEVNKYLVNNQLDLTQIPRQFAQEVQESCIHCARMDRLHSAGFIILSGTAALGDKVLMPLSVAIVAFQISELVAGIVLFPLVIVYPLYTLTTCLLTVCGGLAAFGLYMGSRDSIVPSVKNYSDEFFKTAQAYWTNSNHWYAEADRVVAHFAVQSK